MLRPRGVIRNSKDGADFPFGQTSMTVRTAQQGSQQRDIPPRVWHLGIEVGMARNGHELPLTYRSRPAPQERYIVSQKQGEVLCLRCGD